MKKLMFSLCALCLAGAVSAQVSKAPLSEGIQKMQNSSFVVSNVKMDMQATQSAPARKNDALIDSVFTRGFYDWGGYYTLGAFYAYKDQDLKNGFCNESVIRWAYGTGGFLSATGTGEIGYRFWVGARSYYDVEHLYVRYGVPYAVAAPIRRAPSSSRLQEDGTYDSMPFYFKLYNSSKVGPQQVLASITEYGPQDQYVKVVYPTNPEKYTALTDTVMIAAGCVVDEDDGKGYPKSTLVKSEFKDIETWNSFGDNFCVSMVFPIEWDEKGDTLLGMDKCTWNAMPTIMVQPNGDYSVSDELHSVYQVYDFQKTGFWKRQYLPEGGVRWDDLVKDSITQPNARYAIMPFDWFYFDDGTNLSGEPYMWVYYTELSALQSANKADRYVQLSPVPAVDYVNFSSYADMSRIEIYSLGGQLVKAVNVSGDSYRMDLTGINSGMYVARIYSEKGISSKKLIVR